MSSIAEASVREWYELVEELVNHYDKVDEAAAKEVLRSSEFGDASSEGQVKALLADVADKGDEH